jgi:NAD(P)-dependent dehydrogenase (short-subunit alcohol dehydrogenase family)
MEPRLNVITLAVDDLERALVFYRDASACTRRASRAEFASNAVCPETIDTPMVVDMVAKSDLDMTEAIRNQPIARLGRADEIAAAVL